jgi:mannose-1-phosphate guanylyltransferase
MYRFRLSSFGNQFRRVGRAALHKLTGSMRTPDHRAIILAGGENGPVIAQRAISNDVPMQFCPSFGNESMLERTRKRAALAIPAEQTLFVVTKTQERFYAPLLADVPSSRLVVQPQNRGTAAAILYGLLRSLSVAPTASVAIFPSDHYVADDAAFMRYIDLAFDGVRARPDVLVLLGVTPDGPEADYSWIEMGERIAQYFQLFRVKRFWRKPSSELAARLWRSGCLWNSFVMVARIPTVLDLLMRALPELYASFASIESELGAASEALTLERVYADSPSVNLSEDVLSPFSEQLTVLPVSGVRWSNPGKAPP